MHEVPKLTYYRPAIDIGYRNFGCFIEVICHIAKYIQRKMTKIASYMPYVKCQKS